MRDPYSILGVRKDASQEEIKQAYLKLLDEWSSKNTHAADEMMKLYDEAYEILSNPAKKSAHDSILSTEDTNWKDSLILLINKAMENILQTTGIIIAGLVLISLIFSFINKTYTGIVINADTKEPIQGVAVVASWSSQGISLAGTIASFKDAKESMTDKDGKWKIVGHRATCNNPIYFLGQFIGIPCTQEPKFVVFKPGYCSWPEGFHINTCRGKIQPEGNSKIAKGKTIELPKLTEREDRLRTLPGPDNRETSNLREFMRLINKERRNLGLSKF
jgi:hypothetical protein